MQRIKKKNRFLIIIFFTLKLIIFNIIIQTFVRALTNANIKLKIIRTIIIIDRLLKVIYNLIKET